MPARSALRMCTRQAPCATGWNARAWWSNSPLAESQAFQGSIAPALAAIQLEESLAGEYDKFLQATSLDEIMKKHGIT